MEAVFYCMSTAGLGPSLGGSFTERSGVDAEGGPQDEGFIPSNPPRVANKSTPIHGGVFLYEPCWI